MEPVYFSAADLQGEKYENGWLARRCYDITAHSTHQFGHTSVAQKKADIDNEEARLEKELQETTPW